MLGSEVCDEDNANAIDQQNVHNTNESPKTNVAMNVETNATSAAPAATALPVQVEASQHSTKSKQVRSPTKRKNATGSATYADNVALGRSSHRSGTSRSVDHNARTWYL
jgi:hypothetical protein